jgi:hypothetical protein
VKAPQPAQNPQLLIRHSPGASPVRRVHGRDTGYGAPGKGVHPAKIRKKLQPVVTKWGRKG